MKQIKNKATHVLTVSVGRGVARCLPCSCPATQTQRSTQTHRLHARVPCTCLHGPLVRACPAPAGACYSPPCACAVQYIRSTCSIAVSSWTPWIPVCALVCLYVLAHTPCLQVFCVVLVRALCACVPCTLLRVLSLCLRVGFVSHLVDIVVSFPVPYLVVVHRGSPIVSRSS